MKAFVLLLGLVVSLTSCQRDIAENTADGSENRRAIAEDKPAVAIIGTGTLAGTLGPVMGERGYRVVYGSRDPAREEERNYLLMYLRDFASPDGILPVDFDSLVRESFGELVAGNNT